MERRAASCLGYEYAEQDFPDLVRQIEGIVERYVVASLDWYHAKASRPRNYFRASGTVVILLSVSLPVLATQEYPGKTVILSVASLLIALLSSLNAFFRWEHQWKSYRTSELALQGLLTSWRLRMAAALQEPETANRREQLLATTETLIEHARAVTGAETEEFFKTLEWPRGEKT